MKTSIGSMIMSDLRNLRNPRIRLSLKRVDLEERIARARRLPRPRAIDQLRRICVELVNAGKSFDETSYQMVVEALKAYSR